MSHKRLGIGVLTGLMAWSIAAVPVSGTANAAPMAGETIPTSTVTLFTGDKVILGGPHGATVRPAKGRERTRFVQQKDERGDIHVVPADAAPMLRAKRMDPRLFNVTQLAKNGYDDKTRKDVPLIVSGGRNLAAAKTRDLPSLNGTAVSVAKATGLSSFTTADKIWLDGPVHATLDKSVPQIGAPEAWQSGHTGKGTTVAVLDTGIDATHPDLSDAVASARNFSDSANTDDLVGHGTHVASIVTGKHDKYTGVASDTKLLNGKVLNDHGGGAESWVIAGMEWAAAQGANVVNMSIGSDLPSDGTDPVSQAVNRITAESGALFVISSGNTGGMPGSPGAADAALTVGAVDHNDQLAPFSSRGPRWLDEAIKPDITAPGVDIAAAKAANGRIGDPVDATHVKISGTSMAAPHVAGAAAILAARHPGWKAEQLKATLMGSAKPNTALSVFEQGAGRVDVARAVKQTVHATPATISAGITQWPHNDDTPIKKTLTYHNSGSAQVVMNLASEVRAPDGKTAPVGMFTFSPATITIPAGGEAQTELTIDTRVNGPDGIYSGVVTAGDVRTPVTVTREVESYNVTVKFLGNDGNPTGNYDYRFVNIDFPDSYLPYDPSGTVVARLPKGRYYFDAMIQTGDRPVIANEPEYVVTADATLVVDARAGKPVGFVVDKPNAKPGETVLGFHRTTTWGDTGNYLFGPDFDGVLVLPSKTTAAPKQYEYLAIARMAEPDGKGAFTTSSYYYNVHHAVDGRVPADLVNRVKDSDLAKVRTDYGATAPGSYGNIDWLVVKPLPYSIDTFYTPDFPWYTSFYQQKTAGRYDDVDSTARVTTPRVFKPGLATERWNYGVFGPAFAIDPRNPTGGAARLGDEARFALAMFTDQVLSRAGSALDTGSNRLSKDGREIGSTPSSSYGSYIVPAGPGTFQLHVESTHDLAVSNKIVVDWTFKSDTVAGSDPKPLPMLAVRFAPALDNQNRAARSVPTLVPVHVDHYTGGKAQPPAIQLSHDDGKTWKPAPLLTVNGKWYTVLAHPAGAKSVSLKATAGDADGNTVDQTIIRAFLLK